jgi:hypothetical protein
MIYDYITLMMDSYDRCRNATSSVEFGYSKRHQGRVAVVAEGMVPHLAGGAFGGQSTIVKTKIAGWEGGKTPPPSAKNKFAQSSICGCVGDGDETSLESTHIRGCRRSAC